MKAMKHLAYQQQNFHCNKAKTARTPSMRPFMAMFLQLKLSRVQCKECCKKSPTLDISFHPYLFSHNQKKRVTIPAFFILSLRSSATVIFWGISLGFPHHFCAVLSRSPSPRLWSKVGGVVDGSILKITWKQNSPGWLEIHQRGAWCWLLCFCFGNQGRLNQIFKKSENTPSKGETPIQKVLFSEQKTRKKNTEKHLNQKGIMMDSLSETPWNPFNPSNDQGSDRRRSWDTIDPSIQS